MLAEPTTRDAAAIWSLASSTNELDANSSYAYLLWCRDFARTSVVAKIDGSVVGFVIGFLRPTRPDTVFVWQVAVAHSARGQHIGTAMLEVLLDRLAGDGVSRMESTVTPGNTASVAMFAAVARAQQCTFGNRQLFAADDFPDPHEPEDLYIIAPDYEEPNS